MSPIHILFLVDKLAPAGTQTNLLKIVRGLDRKRFKPYLISLREGGEMKKDFEEAGVETVILKTRKLYSFSGLKTYNFLVKWMREHSVDIVQTHFLHADVLGALAARKAGVKKIIMARRDEGFWRNFRQLWMNRFFDRFADRLLANSQAVAQAVMREEKVPASKLDVIYNGIEPALLSEDLRRAVRRDLGLSDEAIAVGVVANMRHAIKGHAYLLEAMKEIRQKNSQVHLILAGDGDLRPELEREASKLGVREAVHFLGTRRDIPAILNAIDIGCLPSLTEGFSNSILEYMAYQKPVVATAVGGNAEAVIPGTGFLVPPRDAKALAEKIILLAQNAELRKQIGAAGRARVVEKFSIEKMVREYEGFYEQMLRHGDAVTRRSGEEKKHKQVLSASPRLPVSISRVCHLIWALEPGGAERQVITIAQWQKQQGDDPLVVCLTRKGELAGELESQGIPVFLIEKKRGADFSIVKKLAAFLKDHAVDVVHTHVPTASLWGRFAARRAGCPVIVSEHSDMAATNFKFKWVNRLLSRHTAAYLVVSQHIKDLMAGAGIAAGQIKVVRNGIPIAPLVDEATRQTMRAGLGIKPEEFLIGTVGRLEFRKDHSMLLKSFREIKSKMPQTKLLLAGDGPLRQALEQESQSFGLQGSVLFLGVRHDIPALLSALDLFVLSSITEGISISLLEAMAASKVCAATRVGGNPEVIVDGENGRLVPAKDFQAMAAVILDLIRHPEEAKRLSVTARASVVKHFSINSMMEGIEAVYEEVLSRRKIPAESKRMAAIL